MRIGTASIRRRAQLLALEPSLSIEPLRGNIDTRLRKRGERGLDAVVLAACGLDRLGLGSEIGHRFEPDEILPEAGQGALALQVRRGEEQLVAAAERRGDGAQGRARARLRGGDRRRLPRSDRGASRRRDADGAHRRPGRPLGRAPHRRRPGRARVGAGRARRVKVVVTRPRAQAGPLVERLEEQGHEVVECPLIEIEPTRRSGRRRGLRLGDRDEPERRRRARQARQRAAAAGSRPSARERPRRCASSASSPRSSRGSRRRTASSPSSRVPRAASCSRPPKDRGDGRSTSSAPTSSRSTRRGSFGRTSLPRAISSCSPRARPRGRSPRSGSTSRSSRSGPQTTRVAESLGLRVVAEAETHDLDGLVAAVGSLASR